MGRVIKKKGDGKNEKKRRADMEGKSKWDRIPLSF